MKLFPARFKIEFGIVAIAMAVAGFWICLGISQSRDHAFAAAGVAQSTRRRPAKPKKVLETLNYRVAWAAFSNAASVELSVPERRNLYGFETWHFRAVAHTIRPVRTLFALDDQFDSYTDTATLESRQFELHLDEMGKISDDVQNLSSSGQPSHSPGPLVIVSPGTRDALGTLYALRSQDWQRAPDFRASVYDGHNLYDMRAHCEVLSEPVKVTAGNFSAARIAVHVFQYGKELSTIRFEIWIANDPARTPVVIEANLPFGNIRGELLSLPK